MFSSRGFVLILLIFAGAFRAVGQGTQVTRSITEARCSAISNFAPVYGHLGNACDYALSPSTLPNFICDEIVQRFFSFHGPQNWQSLDVLTDEVSFVSGEGEQYSKLTINGSLISKFATPHSFDDVNSYLRKRPNFPDAPRLGIASHFAEELHAIFDPRNQASFKYDGDIQAGGQTLNVFAFAISKSGAKVGGTIQLGSDSHFIFTGLEGLIWIDQNTGRIKRTVSHNTDIDSHFPIAASASSTDYEETSIVGLGNFLLPMRGESLVCERNGGCGRNISTYQNCRRFAASSRIVPAQ